MIQCTSLDRVAAAVASDMTLSDTKLSIITRVDFIRSLQSLSIFHRRDRLSDLRLACKGDDELEDSLVASVRPAKVRSRLAI